MVDRLSPFENQVDGVLRRVEEIDARLRAVEGRLATTAATSPINESPSATQQPAQAARTPAARFPISSLVITSLTGRTSLVLGGGYLLRALTDSGVIPTPLGVTLGFAYAVAWM